MLRSGVTLSDAIDQFADHQRSLGLAPRTRRNELITLRRMLASVGNIQLKHVRQRHLDLYFLDRMDQVAPSTFNHELSQVKVFFKWAEKRKLLGVEGNPVEHRRPMKFVPRTRLRIPADDFDRLLDLAPHPVDRIIFALGIYLLLRQSEIKLLRVGHVDLDDDYIHVAIRKTGQRDKMPVSTELKEELRRYFDWYETELGRPLVGEDFLAPAKSRPKFTTKYLQQAMVVDPERPMAKPHQAIQRILTIGGYELRDPDTGKSNGEGVHTLRRSAARALYDQQVDERGYDGALKFVQALLHHRSVQMTERYLGLELDVKKRDDMIRGKRMYSKSHIVSQILTPMNHYEGNRNGTQDARAGLL